VEYRTDIKQNGGKTDSGSRFSQTHSVTVRRNLELDVNKKGVAFLPDSGLAGLEHVLLLGGGGPRQVQEPVRVLLPSAERTTLFI
jgi:hypothetical protein